MTWLKMLPWIAGALLIGALLWIVNDWRLDAQRLPLVEKELANERATLARVQHDAEIVAAASAGYQSEIALLRKRRAGSSNSPVRVCRPASPASVRVPAPEPGSDGGTAPAGVLPGDSGMRAGPDIGPQLRALADRADEVTAQGRGLQTQADALAPR